MAQIASATGFLVHLLVLVGNDSLGAKVRANWDLVLEKVVNHQDTDALMDLFDLLLTEEERSAIAGRLKVFQALLLGEMSQRQIAAEFEISIATITRCSNYLKHMPAEQRERIKALIL
ncbi:trp operon repressor [Shewanella loihica]|uniref:Trp operon repressor n=1 Tax=Shewanella loihica (strain ATCC BAA-1088 / PV-4) TaxID=323850 RepID=A3QBU9_SHELP|nr:Trp operon repressor [Shewanella loihica PV-4]